MTITRLFAILYWAWIATEVLLQVVTPTSRRQGKLRDRGSLLLLLGTIFASVWGAMGYAGHRGQTIPGSTHALNLAALILLAVGLTLRWTAVLSLGASFSTNVAIHHTQKLRTTGLYACVRHPSYAAMLLIFVSVGVRVHNWISLAILLVFPTAALLYRIHVEEMALREAFGTQYAEYSRTTRRLIPGLY